jgi:hypothetical protein
MKSFACGCRDPRAPGFAEEASRQAALLRGAPEESEVLELIGAADDFDDWAAWTAAIS